MDETIDWKAELRKYEREFMGLPPEPTAEQIRAERLAAVAQKEREERDGDAFAAWMRLSLVVALAVSINLWPYARDCGVGLYLFLVAETSIAVGGLWVTAYTWTHRLGRTHVIALGLALWGMGLLASDVLPRIGYAYVSPTHTLTWKCAATRA